MSKQNQHAPAPGNATVVAPDAHSKATTPGMVLQNSANNSTRTRRGALNPIAFHKASLETAHPATPAGAVPAIRRRAYELYEQRGREPGHDEEDWLRAETEILGTVLRKANVG